MWFYKDQVVEGLIKGFESFVYLIERTNVKKNDKSPIYYIGKKSFYSKRKENGITTLFESDWQEYYGSSDELKCDILKYGKLNFRREILHFCRTKGDSGYLEIKEQMNRDVLFVDDTGYKLYYNKTINSRYHSHPDSFEFENISLFFQKKTYKDGNKCWVTNNKTNKLIASNKASSIIGKKGWRYGRFNPTYNKPNTKKRGIVKHYNMSPKVAIFNKGDYQFIYKDDIHMLKNWEFESSYNGYKSYIATNGFSEKTFENKYELVKYIKEHNYWENINEFNTENKIPAINMDNCERILVSKDEFKLNEMLVPLNTKRIKVKRKNRIVFTGYINLFLLQNPHIPKTLILKALKNKGGFVLTANKKNLYLINEKYSFSEIK
jgi:hypothetical protein